MRSLFRRYQSTPIRFRVASGAFVLGALLVAIAVQATLRSSEQGLRRQFDDRTETLLSAVAAMSKEPLLTEEYAQHNELLQRLSDDEDIRVLDLVDIAGQIVSSSDQSRVGLDSASSIAQMQGDQQYPVIANPVVAVSGEIGTVRFVLDTSTVDRLLEAERRRGLLSGIVGVSFAALVSLLGGWAVTRRVSELESQLDSVDEEGLPYPVRTWGNDEIARLGAALNQRTQRIRDVVQANTKARDDLRLSETVLQLALAAAADAVVEVDLVAGDLKILSGTTTGRTLQDFATTDIDRLRAMVHPDDRGIVRTAVVHAISASPAPAEVSEIEIRVRSKPSQWTHLLLRIHAISDPNGSAARILVAVVDVTEQRLTARHFARVDKMRTIGQLSAGIAHDFNNALAVSRLQLSVLRRPDRDRSRDDERIQQLIAANNNASEMVQRLLQSAAPQPVTPTRVKLFEFIESLSGLLRTILGPNVELRLDSVAENDAVDIDEPATQQVFLNLAKNAVDAMQGVGQVTISIWNPNDRSVSVEVKDTGPGIDSAVLDVLFDPFVTTKALGAGTGLGLATAFEAVTNAAGTITASNTDLGGASFVVTLPLAVKPLGSAGEVTSTDSNGQVGAKRILLVDDNTALLSGLTALLADAGYEVSPATCVRDARDMVAEGADFDLIFTDIGLPDGNGFDLCRELMLADPTIRTLFMSAYLPDNENISRFDGSPVLQKPFEDATVLSKVAAALQDSPIS